MAGIYEMVGHSLLVSISNPTKRKEKLAVNKERPMNFFGTCSRC